MSKLTLWDEVAIEQMLKDGTAVEAYLSISQHGNWIANTHMGPKPPTKDIYKCMIVKLPTKTTANEPSEKPAA